MQKSATLTYDDAGNRTSQNVTTWNSEPETSTIQYTWDAQDRLASVTLPQTVAAGVSTPSRTFSYAYYYRTRRVGTHETRSIISNPPSAAKHTAIVFSGGLSVAEWEQESGTGLQPVLSSSPTVEYTRGPDMGVGVGGLLYTSRSESASASRVLRYNLSNGRGDIVAQSDAYAALTWTASYEAYGKRTKETGENKDKQRGNSKDEDPTGLLNEGFRYRDIETSVWLSRDPAGFVDGPNLYAYVKQNPWTGWDPDGLATVIGNDDKPLAREPKKVKPSVYSKRVIFDHETGGEDNYNAELKKPTWPGGASGVTVGVGYDLGYNTKDQIQKDWGPLMPQGAVEKMQSVAGVKGEKAKGELSKTKGVIVPLETARNVFEQNSVPRFSDETQKTLPGTENLHPHSQGALVSLVFNRGGALKNVDSRKEMRQIRDALVEGKPEKVPQLIRNMKRLWEGKKLGGLLTRRDDEAKMFETGLMMDRLKDVPTGMPANPFNNP